MKKTDIRPRHPARGTRGWLRHARRRQAAVPARSPAPPSARLEFETAELLDNNGGTKYKLDVTLLGVREYLRGKRASVEAVLFVSGEGKPTYIAWGDEQGRITFAARPAEAPVVHFGGPRQMGLEVRNPLVRKSSDTVELMAAVGCKGLGQGTFASLVHDVIPKGIHPRAVLEFPAKTPGGPPGRVELALKQRC